MMCVYVCVYIYIHIFTWGCLKNDVYMYTHTPLSKQFEIKTTVH